MAQFEEKVPAYVDAPLVLVIGCGDMGMGCARALGKRAPILLVDIDGGRLEQCIRTLRHEGYAASGHPCDISNREQVAALAAVLAQSRGVQVLAHVAAVGNTPGGWRAVMDVDLVGAHLIAEAAGPHIVRGGVAILISSTGSYQCPVDARIEALIDAPLEPDFAERFVETLGYEPDFLEAYFIAKQGVNRLAQRLALEWGSREVRAVSLSPGLINSTMGRTGGSALPVYDGSETKTSGSRSEKAAKEVPLGRQGSLLEITSVVEFLASDAASFVNGIDLPVDGGSTALWRSKGVIAR